jgi:ABC-type Na+ efflux pump permease subunit
VKRHSALSEALAVYAKELRSLARDRHTVIYSILVPLFLYPALVWGTVEIMTYARALEEQAESRVIIRDDAGTGFAESLTAARRRRIRLVAPPAGSRLPEADGAVPGSAAARQWLRDQLADAVLILVPAAPGTGEAGPGAGAPGGGVRALLVQNSAHGASLRARERLERALADFRRQETVAAAQALGEDEAFLEVLVVEEKDLSTREEFAKYIASLILPLLMIIVLATGALYPALDATVGEKERGTLETTLLAPARRGSLVAGKYAAVATFSFAAFVLNFLSMLLTLSSLEAQLQVAGFGMGLAAIAIILTAAALLALFLSALMMTLGFLARTFKEGQSFVTPVYLLSVLPAISTSAPDLGLTPAVSLVPVVNICLLFRDALRGKPALLPAVLAVASSALYALAALGIAGRLLRWEALRTGSDVSPRAALRWLFLGADTGRRAEP